MRKKNFTVSKLPPEARTVIYFHKTEVRKLTEAQKIYWMLRDDVIVDGLGQSPQRRNAEMLFHSFIKHTDKEFWKKYGGLRKTLW